MSTKSSTIEYYLEQLSGVPGVAERKMFGEYALYLGAKVVALICDDRFFLKITEPGKKLVGKRYREGFPYPGARPAMLLDEADIEDREKLRALFLATAEALPEPPPKKPRKTKPKKSA